jgi:hypothetical protein
VIRRRARSDANRDFGAGSDEEKKSPLSNRDSDEIRQKSEFVKRRAFHNSTPRARRALASRLPFPGPSPLRAPEPFSSSQPRFARPRDSRKDETSTFEGSVFTRVGVHIDRHSKAYRELRRDARTSDETRALRIVRTRRSIHALPVRRRRRSRAFPQSPSPPPTRAARVSWG